MKASKKLAIPISVGLIGLLILGVFAVSANVNGNVVIGDNSSNSSNSAINPLIPAAKSQPVPQGFTKDQINKAKILVTNQLDNATNTSSKTANINPMVTYQNGDGIFVLRSPIDTQYNVYSYQRCNLNNGNPYCWTVYPSLYIPIKTEVWNDNFQTIGGNQPMSNAWTYYLLAYWNYYTNGWTQVPDTPTSNGWESAYTNSNGVVNFGFKIPYKQYSDKYLIMSCTNSVDGRYSCIQNPTLFTVNWY